MVGPVDDARLNVGATAPTVATSAALRRGATRPIAANVATPLRAKPSVTAGARRITRSFTRQVMHHAAVTLTNTGTPCARSSARRAGVYECASECAAASGRGAELAVASVSATAASTPA